MKSANLFRESGADNSKRVARKTWRVAAFITPTLSSPAAGVAAPGSGRR